MNCIRSLLCLPLIVMIIGPPSASSQPKKQVTVNVSDADLFTWVNAKVKERLPSPEERTLDDIGWAQDIRAALKLARKHNRPVFLFTHDGRMNLGRC